MAEPSYDQLPAASRRRLILNVLVRPALSITVLLLLYYLLPLGERLTGGTVAALVGGLALVAVLLIWQVRQIQTAEHPRLRAVEALAVSLPLFLLVFSAVYFAVDQIAPGSFSEGLSRTDALYFTVTVFATVGFGDIAPVTQAARVVAVIQMVGDLVLVGVVANVIVGAVQTGLRRRGSGSPPDGKVPVDPLTR